MIGMDQNECLVSCKFISSFFVIYHKLRFEIFLEIRLLEAFDVKGLLL